MKYRYEVVFPDDFADFMDVYANWINNAPDIVATIQLEKTFFTIQYQTTADFFKASKRYGEFSAELRNNPLFRAQKALNSKQVILTKIEEVLCQK